MADPPPDLMAPERDDQDDGDAQMAVRGGQRGPDQRGVAHHGYAYAAHRSESQEDRVFGRFHATRRLSRLDAAGRSDAARPELSLRAAQLELSLGAAQLTGKRCRW
jgi:hypothetical protein